MVRNVDDAHSLSVDCGDSYRPFNRRAKISSPDRGRVLSAAMPSIASRRPLLAQDLAAPTAPQGDQVGDYRVSPTGMSPDGPGRFLNA